MPQRIFKRKSSRKCVRNFESSTDETHIGVAEIACQSYTHTAADVSGKGENIPKGTRIPNRVFVGNIAATATEWDLRSRFETYGIVKDVKIVRDHMGISRGYGFVTFTTEGEANVALEQADIVFKGRKLNIAPAIRKQNYCSDSLPQDVYQNEKYPRVHMSEPSRVKKFNNNYAQNSDNLPSVEYETAPSPYENTTLYVDSGTSYITSDSDISQENSQVNVLSYPTIVYVLEQGYQYSGLGIPYQNNGIQEVVQLLPVQQMLY